MSLFNFGDFVLHSGDKTDFLIDCEALTDSDLDSMAKFFAARWSYYRVDGVPRGGRRFAEALCRYSEPDPAKAMYPLLIVDDVLTTGASMEERRMGRHALGVVIFCRAPTWSSWIIPIFRMGLPVEPILPVRAG